jgi:hypothetical protein
MVWKTVGSVLVLRESKDTPSDEEWDGFLAALTGLRKRVSELRALVVTDGGGPSSSQRTRIKDALAGAAIRSAVVSDSIKIRFIASAIMLISKNHASYTTKELYRAYDHLGLSPEERPVVAEALRQLERELMSEAA